MPRLQKNHYVSKALSLLEIRELKTQSSLICIIKNPLLTVLKILIIYLSTGLDARIRYLWKNTTKELN